MLPLHHDPGTDPRPAFQSRSHLESPFDQTRKWRVERRPRRVAQPAGKRRLCPSLLSTFSLSSLRSFAATARGGVEPPLPPYQSDMLPLQHRAAIRGGGNRTRCCVRPRHVGHHYPSPRRKRGMRSSECGMKIPRSPRTLRSNFYSAFRIPNSALK